MGKNLFRTRVEVGSMGVHMDDEFIYQKHMVNLHKNHNYF